VTSSRVKLLKVGKTSFAKPWTAVLISSPQNLARLERQRDRAFQSTPARGR
jgi:uncharacterized protein (DUF4213/DUF364 family)